MISCPRPTQLSEQLFQYSFGRILAGRFNYSLRALRIEGFPETASVIKGDRVFGPTVVWSGQWPFENGARRLLSGDLFSQPGAEVCLSGSFQRYELLESAQESLRFDWLRRTDRPSVRKSSDFVIGLTTEEPKRLIKPELTPARDLPKDAPQPDLISRPEEVRRSSFTEEEVRRLARLVKYRRLYIVVEEPNASHIKRLCEDLHAEAVPNIREAFPFISSFQKIAFSQNTFHWWAAFLSNAREVYFPPCDRGEWGHPHPAILAHDPHHHGIDLRVQEQRYIYDW